jgi:chromosome segregation ATPase
MKTVITKEDVEKAIEGLKSSGKTPTMAAIYAALGSRGSMTTICKIKAELDQPQQPQPTEEAQQAFRNLWQQAYEAGRTSAAMQQQEFERALAVADTRIEELDGELVASKTLADDLEMARAALAADLAQVATRNLEISNLLDEMNRLRKSHAEELKILKDKLDSAVAATHSAEIAKASLEGEIAGLSRSRSSKKSANGAKNPNPP